MDNAGDWLYIVFLIIAGISSLFGSKNKKKRPKQILGQPDREIVTNEDNVPDKCRKYYLEVKERIHIIGIKVNKGNFTATLIRFNQNLNYEKIYVFRLQI